MSTSDLDGLLKEVFTDEGTVNAIPEAAHLTKMVPFNKAKLLGRKFLVPAVLANEHGVTYAAYGDGAFSLEDVSPMTTKQCEVQGAHVALRAHIADEDLFGADKKDEGAFASAVMTVIKSMTDSITTRLEMSMLYGGSGIAETASSSNINATSTEVTFTAASWSAGLWSGQEGARIEFRETGSLTNLVSSGADAVFTVTSVDPNSRTAVITGTSTGISALDTDIGSDAQTVFFKSSYGKEMVGLKSIASNTGELFGIDAATYGVWQGNSITYSSGALSMARILDSAEKLVSRGHKGDLELLVHPKTYVSLNTNEAALRVYDSSYGKDKGERGHKGLCFYGQNGEIRVTPHIFCKAGDAFLVPTQELKRIGTNDVTFQRPGSQLQGGNSQFYRPLANAMGIELMCHTNQALFTPKPSRFAYITGFTVA